jgi:pimeloyl-ACP methyl ester carboxylesterase
MTDTATALEPFPADYVSALERASERRTTRTGSEGDIVWRIWGRGSPLILLHGGTGSWMHWIRNIEPLARAFRLLVPDIPGSGDSGNPQPPISAERIAATLGAGIDDILGADARFAIAGFSMGGLIAGFLAAQAGARTTDLLLVGSTGTGAPRGAMEPLQSWRRLPSKQEILATHRKNLGILMIHDPAKIDELAVYVQSRNAGKSRIRGKHVSHTGTLADCLPRLKGRLAGIWGEFDATAAPYLGERREVLRRFRADAGFDIVEGAGHWVQYEAAERFNRWACTALARA